MKTMIIRNLWLLHIISMTRPNQYQTAHDSCETLMNIRWQHLRFLHIPYNLNTNGVKWLHFVYFTARCSQCNAIPRGRASLALKSTWNLHTMQLFPVIFIKYIFLFVQEQNVQIKPEWTLPRLMLVCWFLITYGRLCNAYMPTEMTETLSIAGVTAIKSHAFQLIILLEIDLRSIKQQILLSFFSWTSQFCQSFPHNFGRFVFYKLSFYWSIIIISTDRRIEHGKQLNFATVKIFIFNGKFWYSARAYSPGKFRGTTMSEPLRTPVNTHTL